METVKDSQGLKNTLMGFISLIVIIAVVSALGIFNTTAVKVEINDEKFMISYDGEIVGQFTKDEIRSAVAVTSLDLGEPVEVISEEKYLVGTWENEEWGQYTLAVKESLECYAVVTTESGVFVFNYESKDTTESICEALLEW
ncbi:MAG: hypothetical protein LUF30_10540 [Lachnospiraceae bacterium]|nr:hypothetical protein [Lachnospiraceae bacterium]